MKKIILALTLLLISPTLAQGQSFSSLEERMTGKEFRETGLHKLTDEELKALNDWLRGSLGERVFQHSSARPAQIPTAPPAPAAGSAQTKDSSASSDERGFELKRNNERLKEAIHAHIDGTFDGWSGNTVFKLDNGMIWEQADKDNFYVRPIENPAVVIKPGMFRTWRLSVEGYGSTVRVKRMQ